MQNFNIKNPDDWDAFAPSEIVEFPCSRAGFRQVAFTVNGSSRVSVYVSASADMAARKLVGSSSGMFAVAYAAKGPSFVQFVGENSDDIFVLGAGNSHVVEATSDEQFTTLIPPNRRSNSEVEKMMHVMRLNEKRRTQQMAHELAALRRDFTPALSKQSESVTPTPVTPADTAAPISAGGASDEPVNKASDNGA